MIIRILNIKPIFLSDISVNVCKVGEDYTFNYQGHNFYFSGHKLNLPDNFTLKTLNQKVYLEDDELLIGSPGQIFTIVKNGTYESQTSGFTTIFHSGGIKFVVDGEVGIKGLNIPSVVEICNERQLIKIKS